MLKPISWYALYRRLGKQPLKKTRGQYVKCYMMGHMWFCKLVYTNNGSDFYLTPIKISRTDEGM